MAKKINPMKKNNDSPKSNQSGWQRTNIINNTVREKHIIEDNKGYYAAYANQAMHNAYVVLSYINSYCFGTGDLKESEMLYYPLFNVFNETTHSTKVVISSTTEKIHRKLVYHFPFVQSFIRTDKNNPESTINLNFLKILVSRLHVVINALIGIRNYSSHHVGGEREKNKELIGLLYQVFEANRSIIKELYNYQGNDLDHLVRLDKNKVLIPDTKIRMDRNGFLYSFYNRERDMLSENGVRFLICLFLEPKDAYLFLKKIPGFKDSRDKKSQSTLQVFTTSSIKLPHETTVSDNTLDGLMLDSINELCKVPKGLFNVLSESDKKKFKPELVFEDSGNELDDHKVENLSYSDHASEIVMKRYDDRFPNLVMKYFDLSEFFKDIRFAIKFGKFYYRADNKTIILEDKVRWLTKDLIGFYRWQDVENWKKNDEINKMLKKTHELPRDYDVPYIQDREPEYITNYNRIMISLENDNSFPILTKDLDTPNYKEPKSFDVNNAIYISGNDFHAFAMYCMLINDGNKIKGIIAGWKKQMINLMEAISNATILPLDKDLIENQRSKISSGTVSGKFIEEYNERKDEANELLRNSGFTDLSMDNIPDKWANYLMCIEAVPVEKRAKQFVSNLIHESRLLLKKYENQINYRRETRDKDIKLIDTGEISSLLAKDFIVMLNVEDELKPNSSEFQELQKTMAYWGLYKDRISDLFFKLKLQSGIPYFKEEWLKVDKGIYDFFKAYYNAKIEYLEAINDFKELYFFKNKRGNINLNTIIGADRRIIYPLALPKDFFTKKCVEHFYSEKTEIRNLKFSEILKLKFPDIQSFYNFPRKYDIFDDWLENKVEKESVSVQPQSLIEEERREFIGAISTWLKDNKNENTTEENCTNIKRGKKIINYDKVKNLYHIMLNNEEQIRWTLMKDRIFLELIRKFLIQKTNLAGIDTLNLSHFSPDSEHTLFNTPIAYSLLYKSKVSPFEVKITEPKMKLKDYGKFRKLLKDRRLPGLFSLWNKAEVLRSEILTELDAYQICRISVSEAIIEFEKGLYNLDMAYFDTIKSADKGQVISHHHFLNYLRSKGEINEIEFNNMATLRNKFQHNQYPNSGEIVGVLLNDGISPSMVYSNYLIEIYNKKIGEMNTKEGVS